jgi:hypothetical protein
MIARFEGSAEDKLHQVASIFADLAPQASCTLSADRRSIICRADRPDGALHVEKLPTNYLPAETVRHAAMQLGKATHPAESIGEWERWAGAWHLIQVHGRAAVDHAAEQATSLEAEGSLSGAELWRDLGRRVAVLQAKPAAWAGQV